MARYIDAEALIEEMQECKYGNPCNDYQRGVNASIDIQIVGIKHMPTADVVPKSEVLALENEIERLKSILDSYALQYGTVIDQHLVIEKERAEVAREIFELIECAFSPVLVYNGYTVKKYIAELKKKYTEDKDEQAPTRDPI